MSELYPKRRKTKRMAKAISTRRAVEESVYIDCVSAERYADDLREIRVDWAPTEGNPDAKPSWEWAYWHYPLDDDGGALALWERRVAQGPAVGAPADVIQRPTVAPLPQKLVTKVLKELTEGFCPEMRRDPPLMGEDALYRRGRVAGLWLHGADRTGAGGVLWALLRVSADRMALVPHMDLWQRREREVDPEAAGPPGAPEDTARRCSYWLTQPVRHMQEAEKAAYRCALARQAAIEERQAAGRGLQPPTGAAAAAAGPAEGDAPAAESLAAPPAAAAAALAAVAAAETVGEGPQWRRKEAALMAELARRVDEAARRMPPGQAPESLFTPADIARARSYKPTLLPPLTMSLPVPDPEHTHGVLRKLLDMERAAAPAAAATAAAAAAAAGPPRGAGGSAGQSD